MRILVLVVVVMVIVAATAAHIFMGNLIPGGLGLISIAVLIDVYLAARQNRKKTFEDRGEMYFRAFSGGIWKTTVAAIVGAISVIWAIWAIFGLLLK